MVDLRSHWTLDIRCARHVFILSPSNSAALLHWLLGSRVLERQSEVSILAVAFCMNEISTASAANGARLNRRRLASAWPSGRSQGSWGLGFWTKQQMNQVEPSSVLFVGRIPGGYAKRTLAKMAKTTDDRRKEKSDWHRK